MKKNKLRISIVIISIFLYIGLFQVNSIYKNRFVNDELNSALKDLKTNYDIVLHSYEKSAESIFYQISKNPEITEILSKSLNANKEQRDILRKRLYSVIKDYYEGSKNLGLKLILFANPDNKAFLRAHKPDKFDDDLTSTRHAVEKVNKEKKKFVGFEPGKITHAFRNIYPMFDKNNNYIGCVDIGFSSEYLQNTLDSVHKIHTHFLVAKDIISKRLWEVKKLSFKYRNSMEDDDYLISIRKDVTHELKDISKATIKARRDLIHKKMELAKEFAIYGDKDGMSVMISFIPIFSIEEHDRPSAYVVSYTKSTQIINILNNYQYVNIIGFIVIVLLMSLVYLILSHQDKLEDQVNEKTKELSILNHSLEERIKEEVEKNRQSQLQLFEQSKNASMGEMIGNIAHQWRQPLSAITTMSSSIKLNNELGILQSEDIKESMDVIINKANYLSETINTFRNFLKDDKERREFVLERLVEQSIDIVGATLKDYYIKLNTNIDFSQETKLVCVESELSQVIINIINNAKDVLREKNIEDAWVELNLLRKDNVSIITIEDNGGGIPEDIMAKIFEPYFTTKHQSQGTGLGLHMSYRIINDSLNGKLYAKNTKNGAKFYIELPVK